MAGRDLPVDEAVRGDPGWRYAGTASSAGLPGSALHRFLETALSATLSSRKTAPLPKRRGVHPYLFVLRRLSIRLAEL